MTKGENMVKNSVILGSSAQGEIQPQDDKREHRDGKDDCGITKVLGNKKSPIWGIENPIL